MEIQSSEFSERAGSVCCVGQSERMLRDRSTGEASGLLGHTPLLTSAVEPRQWMVLWTKARQEKRLAAILESAEVHFILLLSRTLRYYGHRKRQVSIPLFPGYIFQWATEGERVLALESGRVVQVLQVADQARLQAELEQIVRVIDSGGVLDPYPYLEVGQQVRVTSGPFQGTIGTVDRRRSMDRLILIVESIGRAVSLEIDAGLLEPVDEFVRGSERRIP